MSSYNFVAQTFVASPIASS